MKSLWQRVFLLLLGLSMIWPALAVAAPQITWSDQIDAANRLEQRNPVTIDLRQVWQATRLAQVSLTNAQYFDPQEVWGWHAQRFDTLNSRKDFLLHSQERLVARMTLFSETIGTDLNLTAELPRLDAIHVSYRHDNGPWTTLSAGDTLPMNSWLVPDRHPTFHIPQLKGQTDLVVQLAHRGIAFGPIVLQNERARNTQLTFDIGAVGLVSGVLLMIALASALMAVYFKRMSFLVITFTNLITALLIFFNSGLGGLYIGTSSATFNDQAKFFFNTLICFALPLVAATVLGLYQRSKNWLVFSSAWLVFGSVFTLFWMNYAWRDTTTIGVPVLLIMTLLVSTGMVGWSILKFSSLQAAALAGLIFYAFSLLMPFTGLLGVFLSTASLLGAAALMLISSMLLIQSLYARHRMGNQVLARASISPLRDVLTGLLNREGMQGYLFNKIRERTKNENTCGLFIYISVMDAEHAMFEYGEQGFEMGMVQIAASLSNSVTATDGLGRVSGHAFAVAVLMPPDGSLATSLAQKILTRLMALSLHGAPLAGTARMALSWMPLNGFRLDNLERRSLRAIEELDPAKKIGWVGGPQSQADAANMLLDTHLAERLTSHDTLAANTPGSQTQKSGPSSDLNARIHRIEREMLHGVDTRFLVADAERMSRAINEASPSYLTTQASDETQMPEDYEPTEFFPRQPAKSQKT